MDLNSSLVSVKTQPARYVLARVTHLQQFKRSKDRVCRPHCVIQMHTGHFSMLKFELILFLLRFSNSSRWNWKLINTFGAYNEQFEWFQQDRCRQRSNIATTSLELGKIENPGDLISSLAISFGSNQAFDHLILWHRNNNKPFKKFNYASFCVRKDNDASYMSSVQSSFPILNHEFQTTSYL